MNGAVASCAGAAGADARAAVVDDDDDGEEGDDVDAGARRSADMRPARIDAMAQVAAREAWLPPGDVE